jgi:hypothetical protein
VLGFFRQNLKEADKKKVAELQLFIDIYNIRAMLLDQPLDKRGSLSREALGQELYVGDKLPSFVKDFMDEKRGAAAFPLLLLQFFEEAMKSSSPFLRTYFAFERDYRLVFAYLRAKKQGKEFLEELPVEERKEPLVLSLSQGDIPQEFQLMATFLEDEEQSPEALFEKLSRYRFDKIDEMTNHSPFSIEYLLAYAAKLYILEKWREIKGGR